MPAALALVLALAASPTAGWESGREYVYLEGGPGTVLEDRVTVTNPGPRRLTVDLRASRAPTPWIALAADRVTIPARTRAEIPFTVTVPADTPPGEQTATITASAGGRSEPIRIHLRVSGPEVPALTVEDVSYSGGSVHYTLVNRGNTAVSPRVALHTDGLLTGPADRPPREPGPLPPASRISLSERWDAPALDAVDLRLRVTAAGGVRTESTLSRTFVPWPVLPALLLLLPVPLWFRRRAKRAGG
ncbi:hypothetical protein AB0903_13995 [Streptomyces sp. NPDC048389]|uniref:COG1470 family protein n=1 Tax=Streptomyces sp. NPDC048389 TaxID=3154622 RepID=UPI00345313B5